jgi:hypothetical protein
MKATTQIYIRNWFVRPMLDEHIAMTEWLNCNPEIKWKMWRKSSNSVNRILGIEFEHEEDAIAFKLVFGL